MQDLPVRAVMVTPPYYWKPVEIEGLRMFFQRVVAGTVRPPLVPISPSFDAAAAVEFALSGPGELVAEDSLQR